ncbi:uncharacterized protein TRIADDRAFT_56931 [Trichoplax adhaerens]|uniref:Fibronectin type-III domain-containing protein n=1 Tax=Trichoplax adhaerens TaxID=10228 RepID=B3RWY7_TRIAD|nr:predicted protein [Trichoplax adhaerens]EDV25214.1 predicted protein [Trichoplax adhaerens]|eukprot:XP_002113104.1 predicted protein [Trichoplax adhaerens]
MDSSRRPPANVASKVIIDDSDLNYGGKYFNIEDRGTCTNVRRVTIWYYICPETNYGEASFPRVIAPASKSIIVQGRCSGTSASSADGIKPTAECTANGEYINYVNNCPCAAGKDRRSIQEGLPPVCYDCPVNYFKPDISSNPCKKCPLGTVAIVTGSKKCLCTRDKVMHISNLCINIPTCPLTYLRKHNQSVDLRIGYIAEELKDKLIFDLECFNCSGISTNDFARRFRPIIKNMTIAKIYKISNLKPFTTYWMRVTPIAYLRNIEQRKLPCQTILVTTNDGVPGPPKNVKALSRVDVKMVSIRWKPPVEPNGLIKNYLIKFTLISTSKANVTNKLIEIYEEIVSGNILMLNTSKLEDQTTYRVTVKASTRAAIYGAESLPVNVTVYAQGISAAQQIAGGVAGGVAATAVGLALVKLITDPAKVIELCGISAKIRNYYNESPLCQNIGHCCDIICPRCCKKRKFCSAEDNAGNGCCCCSCCGCGLEDSDKDELEEVEMVDVRQLSDDPDKDTLSSTSSSSAKKYKSKYKKVKIQASTDDENIDKKVKRKKKKKKKSLSKSRKRRFSLFKKKQEDTPKASDDDSAFLTASEYENNASAATSSNINKEAKATTSNKDMKKPKVRIFRETGTVLDPSLLKPSIKPTSPVVKETLSTNATSTAIVKSQNPIEREKAKQSIIQQSNRNLPPITKIKVDQSSIAGHGQPSKKSIAAHSSQSLVKTQKQKEEARNRSNSTSFIKLDDTNNQKIIKKAPATPILSKSNQKQMASKTILKNRSAENLTKLKQMSDYDTSIQANPEYQRDNANQEKLPNQSLTGSASLLPEGKSKSLTINRNIQSQSFSKDRAKRTVSFEDEYKQASEDSSLINLSYHDNPTNSKAEKKSKSLKKHNTSGSKITDEGLFIHLTSSETQQLLDMCNHSVINQAKVGTDEEYFSCPKDHNRLASRTGDHRLERHKSAHDSPIYQVHANKLPDENKSVSIDLTSVPVESTVIEADENQAKSSDAVVRSDEQNSDDDNKVIHDRIKQLITYDRGKRKYQQTRRIHRLESVEVHTTPKTPSANANPHRRYRTPRRRKHQPLN